MNGKKALANNLLLYPCPVLLITSKRGSVENVFTVSWAGIACSHPEYITIAINPKRYSYMLIKESGCFTANIVNKELLKAADYCGTHSGREYNKFSECQLTRVNGISINVPIIKECPINIECSVEKRVELGSHTLFISRVINKIISDDIASQNIHEGLDPLAYFRPYYYSFDTTPLGSYGDIPLKD